MRRLNRRLEVDGEPIPRVAREALVELGLLGRGEPNRRRCRLPAEKGVVARTCGTSGAPSLRLTARHLLLVLISLGAAVAVALPLGLALERLPRGAEGGDPRRRRAADAPGIALLAFMIPLLGIGVVPALVALFLYSIYPILRNTYTGVRDAAPEAVAAGRALG